MPSASPTQLTPERLMQFTFGYAPALIIEAAIRHRVFDLLEQGAGTIGKLCDETRTSPRGLRMISGWLRDAGFEDVRTVEAPGLAPLLILATKPRPRNSRASAGVLGRE